jgi:aryl-alcohol dehydrogenase-like predicted oxidoreductase
LRVSELCLGTLTFGENKAWGADAEAAGAILRAFADAGGTFLDTAPNYGGGVAEEVIGRFVAGQRDDFVIATKYTAAASRHPLAGGNSRKSMIRSVEGSLRRLETDHIDLLWLHYWDSTTPLDEIMRALDDLVRAGKLLYIGISDTPAWLIGRAALLAEMRGWSRVIATQLEYNLAARTAERELLPMAQALDLGIVCWGPLAAGALAGGDDPKRRSASAVPPPIARIAEAVRTIARDAGLPPAALALRWLMARGSIPLVGARTPEQIIATIMAAESDVAPALLAALDDLAPPEMGFPHDLIGSSYLRKLALGDPAALLSPDRARA